MSVEDDNTVEINQSINKNLLVQQFIIIEIKTAKFNFYDENEQLKLQISILRNGEIRNQVIIEELKVYGKYILNFEENDESLQILLINNEIIAGQSNQTIQTLFDNEIKEIKLIHDKLIVGILGICFSKIGNVNLESQRLKNYLQQTGLQTIFEIIYAEILSKNLNINDVFKYTAKRLRQIGQQIYIQKE